MRKYSQLGILEREKVQEGLWEGKSIRAIAIELGRNPSTISREIKRNLPRKHLRYTPRLAQERKNRMVVERGKRARLKDPVIKKYVVSMLKEDYSPEQIAGTLPDAHPGYSISHEAIYQFIYAQYNREGYGNCIGLDLRKYLKRHHRVRQRKHLPFAKESGKMLDIVRITERPEIVNSRARFGDWEGDSMVSRKSPVGLNTLVERKSGYVLITKIKNGTKEETTKAVVKRLSKLPEELRCTLTVDNGHENAGHKDIHEALGTDIYFTHPYCSQERGTNENTNGLIRYYFPKGTDFATVHPNTIRAIERKLNARPRKRHGYKTPEQIFNEALH